MTMKTGFGEDNLKYWRASTHREGTPYRQNRCIGVVAKNMIEAIDAIKQKHPDDLIVNLSHVGAVDVQAS